MTRSDWPGPGPIDLAVHDPPHRSSTTEWWYLNSHFETADGRRLSLFAAFFRIVAGRDEATGGPRHAHSFTWALVDASGRTYLPDSRVDEAAPRIGLERIQKGAGSRDPRINRAMSEVLERGRVPAPDRAFDGPVHVDPRRLELDFAGATLARRDDGSYRLHLANPRAHVGCDLVFHPGKPPVRHGDDGHVRGHGGEEMFYYFIPRCRVTGTVTLGAIAQPVTNAIGWYDHEFGGPPAPAQPATGTAAPATAPAQPATAPAQPATGTVQPATGTVQPATGTAAPATTPEASPPSAPQVAPERVDIAWNWASVQLDNGHEVSAYSLVRLADHQVLYRWAIHIDPAGRSTKCSAFSFEPVTWWRSMRTFHDYPVRFTLAVPEIALDLTLLASFADQEFVTVLSKPAFWEGRCEVQGTLGGTEVRGLGFVERSGFEPIRDLDEFFSAVGEEVRRSVERCLPRAPTAAQARDLIASEERAHYLDGVDLAQLGRTLFAPIRDITDRGGKSWRSYAALACCDVVGGDSRRFVQWLAMPELLHVGSLIVDDVQDRSTVRRGQPAAHLLHGEPLAINAGTAAYFITQRLLVTSEVSPSRKLRLYDLYFEAMRAGHAGQALDLGGLADIMPEVVATGDGALLERRILAAHRLKTAAPAGALARMGAVVGGGSEAQIEGVGHLFESLGLAFQFVDDVLNLRGFRGGLKSAGEDLVNGNVTLPVAKAMSRLPAKERAWLWRTIESQAAVEPGILGDAIALIERCGALDACSAQASALVEAAWHQTEPLLDDSMSKVMLRAFGWYVLERHY